MFKETFMDPVKKFINDYFFFNIPKNEKDKIRTRIMDADHKGYVVVVAVIFFFQLLMLASNITTYGVQPRKLSALGYRYLYMSLIVVIAFNLILVNNLYKSKKTFAYFVMVSLTMVSVLLWSVGIVVFDSFYDMDLTTFAYVVFSSIAFMLLEPWIVAINVVSVTILLNILLRYLPIVAPYYGFGTMVQSSSICILAIMVATYNFTKRIHAMRLEMEVESLNETLAEKAYVDSLTGVYSRHFLTEHIDDLLNLGFAPSGVMMLDLDHFKDVNDTFGHQNGDVCLQAIAGVVKEFMKNKDGYAVRYGGEEFFIYIEHADQAALLDMAEDLRKRVENTSIRLLDETHIIVTISIGVAVAAHGQTYSALIDEADQALYRAKETRNAVSK